MLRPEVQRTVHRDARRCERLTALHYHELAAHFLSLSDIDRLLRFGRPMGDAALIDYLNGIDFERDALFGVHDAVLELIGVAHLGLQNDIAELGVSVLATVRRQGIGLNLLEHARAHAQSCGVTTLFMYCLSTNEPMRRLAQKAGMRTITTQGESEASLSLAQPPAAELLARESEPSGRPAAIALADHVLCPSYRAARRVVQIALARREETTH